MSYAIFCCIVSVCNFRRVNVFVHVEGYNGGNIFPQALMRSPNFFKGGLSLILFDCLLMCKQEGLLVV